MLRIKHLINNQQRLLDLVMNLSCVKEKWWREETETTGNKSKNTYLKKKKMLKFCLKIRISGAGIERAKVTTVSPQHPPATLARFTAVF